MTWHDQIEACTNAENVSAAWKCLELYEKELYRNHQKSESMKHRLRDCLAVARYLVSDEKRKGGWCWLLYDEWNHEMASNN